MGASRPASRGSAKPAPMALTGTGGRMYARRSAGQFSRWGPSEEASWRVTLRGIDGERFVVLPDGTLEDPPWTVRGRPALKLSSEGGSCMTELERQLVRSLRTLSAESRTKRRQHAEGQWPALRAGRSVAAAFRAAGRGERDLAAAVRAARRANDTLAPGLRDARRDIARALDVMRQRDRERDHGPGR